MRSVPAVAVDTNVFLRYFLDDDEAQAARAESLFAAAARGEVRLMTSPLVIAEIVWTMQRVYKLERAKIAEVLTAILVSRNVVVGERATVERALAWYGAAPVDWGDAYLAAYAIESGIPEVVSFDRRARGRFPGVVWREP